MREYGIGGHVGASRYRIPVMESSPGLASGPVFNCLGNVSARE